MQTLVWEGPRRMVLREQPEPVLAPDEVLIRVAYAGICGSELSGYLGENSLRVPPLVMGHELAGTVLAVGDAAAARLPRLAEGVTVTVNPLAFCGECEYCRTGKNQLCTSRKLVGAHRPGAFAQLLAVPADLVSPLPQGMDLRQGALTEPAAVGVRIGEMAGDVAGADILVVGAGPIGLLALQVLRHHGAARVFVADLEPARLSMATELGGQAIDARAADVTQEVRAATAGHGVRVAVEAVGTARTRATAIASTQTGGTVVLSGLHEETGMMPVAEVIRRELRLQGSFAYTPANFATALDLLARGVLRLDPWITEAPLAEGGAWFERLIAAPGNVAKVLLVP